MKESPKHYLVAIAVIMFQIISGVVSILDFIYLQNPDLAPQILRLPAGFIVHILPFVTTMYGSIFIIITS